MVARAVGWMVFVLLAGIGTVPAQDDYEPDNQPLRATPVNDTDFGFCRFDLSAFLPQSHTLHTEFDQDWFTYPDLERGGCFIERTFQLRAVDGTASFRLLIEAFDSNVLSDPQAQPVTTFGRCVAPFTSHIAFNLDSQMGSRTGGFFFRVRPCPGFATLQSYVLEAITFGSCLCSDLARISGVVRAQGSGQVLPFEFLRTDQNAATFTSPNGSYELTALGGDVIVSLESALWDATDVQLTGLQPSTTTTLDIVATRKEALFASNFEGDGL